VAARSVDEYLAGLSGWQAEAVTDLRAKILAAGEVTEAFKWAEPVYEAGGPVCWIKAHGKHVTFGFWRGVALMAQEPRLTTSGEKMAHIKVTAPGQLTAEEVAALVRAGAALNAELGNPARAR
jgi:hypothetical protein